MAIRKDIDDMLNNLKDGKPLESPSEPEIQPESPKFVEGTNMTVDELLTSLIGDSNDSSIANKPAETAPKPKKMKIVISHELPDYEALRAEEKKREAEQAMAEKIAERDKLRAEREAEIARIEAERKAAEEAELARIEAERKAAKEAEMARIEAERKAAEEAELARIEAERRAAEEAELARIEAERKAAEEAELARIEAERIAIDDEISALESPVLDLSEPEPAETIEESAESVNAKPKFTNVLRNILDEDPDAVMNRRYTANYESNPRSGKLKKGFYAVFGVIFSLLACVGLVTVVAKSISFFSSYSSGESKKDGFAEVLYPAVIMDIESFNSPTELPPEQIITAAIWSMIMADGVTSQYELTFDVVMIPAADVESYAVKLFGENIPQLTHTTVGPAESRFYYNEETKSYNVPVAPVTYTYTPEIKEATKNGSEYTVKVDYIDELPSWLPKSSSKSVEFTLIEKNGEYQLKSMEILSTNTSAV
ncbi:MAG: hypothetical protein IKJ87_07845 [Ruminococcus sp.]|nr:hypothetical protein [Ruminococcus sp.]